mmetsp:Transcript_22080/g.58299  ORF Transcript_22080/g.58299 Transcript_22080/m.58299 type:complete len:259 (+) Transcript_22080:3-779(+)
MLRRDCLRFSRSASNSAWMRVVSSLARAMASSVQCSMRAKSTGMPPGLCRQHSSPCWFTAIDSEPHMATSSRRLGSATHVVSASLLPGAGAKSAKVTGTGRWWTLSGTGTRSSAVKTLAAPPWTLTSAFRKWSSAQSAATEHTSPRFPSSSRARTSTRMLQTFWPPTMHSASASTALLPLMSRSTKLETAVAFAEGRPTSKLGEAIGPNSTWKAIRPSFGRSGGGVTISPEQTARARVGPNETSTSPCTTPNFTLKRL